MEHKINNLFNKVVSVIFTAILAALIISLTIGCVKLFIGIWSMVSTSGITGKYLNLITDVLTLFVLVELSKSLVDYFKENRLRMTFIVDAAIVFVIREMMIMLFQQKSSTEQIYAISAFLLVLTILRIGSIMMFQKEAHIVKTVGDNCGRE